MVANCAVGATSHPVLGSLGGLTPPEVAVGRVAGRLSYLAGRAPTQYEPQMPRGAGICGCGQQEWKHSIEGHQAQEAPLSGHSLAVQPAAFLPEFQVPHLSE